MTLPFSSLATVGFLWVNALLAATVALVPASAAPANPSLYRDLTAYPPYSLNWSTDTDLQRVRSVYPHPFLQRRALVATETGLLITDDDGHTWTNLPEAAVEKIGPINDIAFHPVLPDTFYLASQTKGLWVTTDNGKTFSPIGAKAKGMAADAVTSLIVYSGDAAHRTLLAAHGDAAAGLSRSRDGGQTWDVVNTEYHFSRLFSGEAGGTQFYLFGSTLKEPDIQSVYTCSTVGEFITEVVRDVVPTDLVFAPIPFRHDSLTYLTTSDSGLYCIDNSSPFGMAYNVTKLPYPGVDGWAGVGATWGPTAEVLNLFLYDPAKTGLVVASQKLAFLPPNTPDVATQDITQSVIASDGLPVSPLTREGSVLRPNANGTVCYATANGALSIGRVPEDVPVVDFNPAAFEVSARDDQSWRELVEIFRKFADGRGSSTDDAKAICRRVPDLASFYRSHQITVTARVPVKPSPPRSVTIDLSRYGGLPDTPLYDDGRHDDGAAGDGVYGVTFLFLPDDHRNEDDEWRCAGPGRIAMGVVATYADGKRRGAVGVVNFFEQLLDLFIWGEGPGSVATDVEGGVTATTFLNPLAPNQPAYAPRLHKGDVAVRLQVPKGPWTVHFKMAYDKHNIDGYPGLSLYLRLEAGDAPKELYLQLRDEPEFSPPTTTDRAPLLNGLTLNADYQRVSVPMSQVLGPASPFQTDHLTEIILSGNAAAPATLVIDGLSAIAAYPPPTTPDPAQ